MGKDPLRVEMLGGLRVRLGDRTLERFGTHRAGVLAGDDERSAKPRCELYRRYLTRRLS
jgi:hypothetical protein